MRNIVDLQQPLEFDWDEHNANKVRLRHNITPLEAEQAFLSDYSVFYDDRHSALEKRFQLVGPNNQGRILFIVFTIRQYKIRIISARAASRKERFQYGKKT